MEARERKEFVCICGSRDWGVTFLIGGVCSAELKCKKCKSVKWLTLQDRPRGF
jgi:hypothetical protein